MKVEPFKRATGWLSGELVKFWPADRMEAAGMQQVAGLVWARIGPAGAGQADRAGAWDPFGGV